MRKLISLIFLIIILVSVFSCSKKEKWDGKIEYEEGIKIVTNYEKGIWDQNDADKKIIFTEVLEIGKIEGDENYIFHQPMDVIADKDGNIYVLDSGNHRIQKFDNKGNYLLTIGKKGQGPGEISNPRNIVLDSHENILIFDANRITKFGPEGSFIGSFNLKFIPFCGVVDSEDNIYVHSRYKGKLVHKLDSQGQHLISFMDEVNIENKRVQPHVNTSWGLDITNEDNIVLVLSYPYTIFTFDKQGNLLEKIITETGYATLPYITPPTAIIPNAVIQNYLIVDLNISPQGYIFCRLVSFEKPETLDTIDKVREFAALMFKEYTFVDLFDVEGRFLIHQNTKNLSRGGSFDSAGYYYGIKELEDRFTAVKFSVQFK